MRPFGRDLVPVVGCHPRMTAVAKLYLLDEFGERPVPGGPVSRPENRHGLLWVECGYLRPRSPLLKPAVRADRQSAIAASPSLRRIANLLDLERARLSI